MIQIGHKDLFWNYGATFLKIASSVLLLPFILRMMPPEMVGIWTIFMTITSFSALLDFGFNPSFTRNVTYVFSGVSNLKTTGVESITKEEKTIDFGLLKGIIRTMQGFYLRMAIILFLLLTTLGTWYVHEILKNYHGDQKEVYLAWGLLCIINTYNLYTLYYDALLQGKGLIKKSKQIVIVGQLVYLLIAASLIMKGFGLVAIVSAQAASVFIIRFLSYRSFFTTEIRQKLHAALSRSKKEILKAISPNAIKIGLTTLGSFSVQKSAIVIGSMYLPLKDIGSYGITLQLISILAGIASIYTATYAPKIAHLRVSQNIASIRKLYLNGLVILVLTYLAGGLTLVLLGSGALNLIKSQTQLLPVTLIAVALIISLLESNHAIAGGILLTNNEVPFFKASLFAGATTILLVLLLLNFTTMGIWAMILAPGIAHLYNNWKWPYEVVKQLNIKFSHLLFTDLR